MAKLLMWARGMVLLVGILIMAADVPYKGVHNHLQPQVKGWFAQIAPGGGGQGSRAFEHGSTTVTPV